jgi:Phage portal protein, SPP1 Gp6-like
LADLESELKAQLKMLGAELDRRTRWHKILGGYYEGDAPLPSAVVKAKITSAYQILMPFASSNWAGLIVDSVQDRLEIAGVRSEDKRVDDVVWGAWQDNQMDSETKLAHNAALVDGRCFAMVWPDEESGKPCVSLDDESQMIVAYAEGSRKRRVCAMRRWVDEKGVPYATLYRPEGIYKFVGPKSGVEDRAAQTAIGPLAMGAPGPGNIGRSTERAINIDVGEWRVRQVEDEEWPLPNPLGIVPVVEVAVNRRLKPGTFGYARGEFEHTTGHLDRINILSFLGLVVAFWMGFPLRAVIGDRILKDDEGNDLPPFRVMGDQVAQFEKPETKLDSFSAADLSNLSVEEHVKHLAAITKTPAHYLLAEMVNLSADAIRASEAALASKVTNHKASLGEGWEEVMRLVGFMTEPEVQLSPRAEVLWADHESRSMAERADSALKLKEILPWQALAEKVLGATQNEIGRWEAQRAGDGLSALLAQVGSEPKPSGNGAAVPA